MCERIFEAVSMLVLRVYVCDTEVVFEFEIPMVKLLRAYGGCLGIERRRKAWKSAKSLGEPTNR
jgi:hypothetical protein